MIDPDLMPFVGLSIFIVALCATTFIFMLVCWMFGEEPPGFSASLGIKLVATLVEIVVTFGLFMAAVASARQRQASESTLASLTLFAQLVGIMANVGVYRVIIPEIRPIKAVGIAVAERVVTVLVLVGSLIAVVSLGWIDTDQLQQLLGPPK